MTRYGLGERALELYTYEGFVLSTVSPGHWRWHHVSGRRNMDIHIVDLPDGVVLWGDALSCPVALRYKSAGFFFGGPHNLGYFTGKVAGAHSGQKFDEDYLTDDIEALRDDPDTEPDVVAALDDMLYMPDPLTYETFILALADELPLGYDMSDVYERRLGWGPTDDVLRAWAAHRVIVAGDHAPIFSGGRFA